MLILSAVNLVSAVSLNNGDVVEVINDGGIGIVVRGPNACDNQIGTKKVYNGDRGVVLDGPVTCNGYTRWKVRWTDGIDGWVAQGDVIDDYLKKVTIASSTKFSVGNSVTVSWTELAYRSEKPDLAYLGSVYSGAQGTVTAGPFYGITKKETGITFTPGFFNLWKVDYGSGKVGWSVEDGLTKVTCTNECSSSGATTCSGSIKQTCGNYDADSCLEWGNNLDCGSNYCDAFGINYCNLGSVYHSRTCYNRGCSSGACYSNSYTESPLVQTCSNGCLNGACLGCVAKTCSDLGKQCGGWDNGCQQSIDCGSCGSGQTCNADGQCVGGSSVLGVDVSHNQQTINWTKVYNAGYRFAFVKATEGDSRPPVIIDSNFTRNMDNSKNAGILSGAYHFAHPEMNNATNEAEFFISVANNYLKQGYLRPALDLEKGCNYADKTVLSNWVNEFMSTVKRETGVEPLIYVTRDYASNCLDNSIMQYNLWIAAPDGLNNPPTNLGIWSNWDFWQYSWTGSVPGINSDVDLDVFSGDLSSLNSFVISSTDSYPRVNSFSVSPSSGSPFTINFSASDDKGLSSAELWRASELYGQPYNWTKVQTKSISGTTYPGSFTDTPIWAGNYWYGVHVVDNSGDPNHWNDEQNSQTQNLPGIYGPTKVTAVFCADDCLSGATRCSIGNIKQTCGNYDADSCVEWGGDFNCPNGCDVYTGDCIGESGILVLRWPLSGTYSSRDSSYYKFGSNWIQAYCGGLPKKHVGVDLNASIGEDISASYEGVVMAVSNLGGNWAKGIVIDSGSFTITYEHVDPLVSVGDSVVKGQLIARVANIAPDPTHLHFGIRNSSYSSISIRGALPQIHDNSDTYCQNDPLFPEKFIDPLSLTYEYSDLPICTSLQSLMMGSTETIGTMSLLSSPDCAVCFQSSDCGTEGFTGNLFCQNGNVYQDYVAYTCNNAGTTSSSCSSSTESRLISSCSNGCSNGQCVTSGDIEDTGWKSPSSNKGIDAYPQYAWTNAANAYASDNVYATALQGDGKMHSWYNFGLSVPAGATIKGIEVSVEAKTDTNPGCGSNTKIALGLTKNKNNFIGYGVTPTLTSSDVVYTLGGPTDLWLTTWSPSDFGTDFGVSYVTGICGSTNPTTLYSIDQIRIKVYYSLVPPQCTQNSDCGTNGLIGGLFCQSENVFQNYITYSCNNPGMAESYCSNSNSFQLIQNCGLSYCNDFGGDYCKADGNVYHSRTCYDNGCSSGTCTSNSFIDEQIAQTCSSNQVCSNGACIIQPLPACNPSDFNSDGAVDASDYITLKMNFGTAGSKAQGDVNGDGIVDWGDLQLFMGNTGSYTGACVEPSCFKDSDCGTDGLVGNLFCQSGNVSQNYTTYTCNNAGTTLSSCSSSVSFQLKTDCGSDYCDAFGSNYCSNGNVYHSRTCYDKGCSSGTCFSNSSTSEELVQTCLDGCSNGQCVIVYINDTGWKSPSSNKGIDGFGVEHSWANPANAYLSDNLYATALQGDQKLYSWYNFGLSIPAGATIKGIEVSVEAKADSTTYCGDGTKISLRLTKNKNDGVGGTGLTPTLTSSDAVYTLGSPTDLWYTTWSPSDFGTDFGVSFVNGWCASNPTTLYSIDQIRIKVYYSLVPPQGISGAGYDMLAQTIVQNETIESGLIQNIIETSLVKNQTEKVKQKDLDKDGVDDKNDLCLDTNKKEKVDKNGCSAEQFCSLIKVTSTNLKDCTRADWKSNEPKKKSPLDCIVENVKKSKDKVCVSRASAN